jgi:integrase
LVTLKEHKTARKTGKPRRIPIGRKLGELLAQAIAERQAGPIFLSPAGKARSVPNLSRTYSRLRDLAGLPRDLVLYLARHECGTKICREKGIEYARRLLGHTNISTTQRYMHLDERELAEAQDLVDERCSQFIVPGTRPPPGGRARIMGRQNSHSLTPDCTENLNERSGAAP